MHLSELIEACDNDLDAAATADLSQPALVQLFWLMVRLKPTTSVGTLRVGWYTDLNTICRNKYLKLVANPSTGVQEVMTQIKAQASLEDPFVDALCQTQGWDAQWMAAPEKGRGKGKAKAKALPAGQHVLPFQAAAPKAPVAGPPAAVSMHQTDQTMTVTAPAAKAVGPGPAPALSVLVKAAPVTVAKSGPMVPAGTAAAVAGSVAPPLAKASNAEAARPAPPLAKSAPLLGAACAGPETVVPPPAHMAVESGVSNSDVQTGDVTPAAGGANSDAEVNAEEGYNNDEIQASASLGAVAKAAALVVPSAFAEHAGVMAEQDQVITAAELEQCFDDAVRESRADAENEKIIMCGICRDEIKQDAAGGEQAQALQCGHVYHRICLEKTWSIAGWPRGWCPQRCLDHIIQSNGGVLDGQLINTMVAASSSHSHADEFEPDPEVLAAPSGGGCGASAAVAEQIVDGDEIAI